MKPSPPLPLPISWLLVGALLAACGEPAPKREWTPDDHGQPANADPTRVPEPVAEQPTEPPEVRAARALWVATCASCHGREGRGDGPGRPPGAQIADFTRPEFQSSRTDAQLAESIRDGRGLMPAFGEQLNAEGIRALVGHIRRLAPELGAQAPEPDANPPEPAGSESPRQVR